MSPISPFQPTPHPWRWRTAAVALLLASAAWRLFYLTTDAAPDLAPDEAHYWDWSRNLDWSYYSKGPLVAWLIRASCELLGNTVIAVRLPAVVCGTLLLGSLYVLAVQVFRSDKFAFGAVVGLMTLPVMNVAGVLMTIDSPFTCCWGWALVFGHAAMVSERKWAYPAAGVMIALGVMAKYTMALWGVSAFLFLLMTPTHRKLLAKPGFWVMAVVGMSGLLPILWWNAANGWVTFAHVGTQAGVRETAVRWFGPVTYFGGQFALLLGFWFVAWLRGVWASWDAKDVGVRFLWWMSVPTFVLFGLFSLTTKIQLNWPVTAYLSGGVLTVAWIVTKMVELAPGPRRLWVGTYAAACLFGVAVNVFVYDVRLARPVMAEWAGEPTLEQPYPVRRLDPTSRLRGWHLLADEVDRCRAELAVGGIEPVILTNRWNIPGELGFYCADHPDVFTLGPYLGDRHSQYDLWRPNPLADPEVFLGRPFIYVGGDEFLLVAQAFDRVEEARRVEYAEDGFPLAAWTVWICHGFRGMPELPPSPTEKPRY